MSISRKTDKVRLPPFVPIDLDVLESTAYTTLPPSAAKLYPYFIRSCSRAKKGMKDTTTIFDLTYTEIEKYGFAKGTTYEAIKALKEHGFIDVVTEGGLRGAGRSNSKYKLSTRWATYGGLDWAKQLHKDQQKAERDAGR